jgi:hypothetical protein
MDRLAKVMGRELEKEFMVKVSGGDTEVPRDIYDKISMAVLQMMKNSMDHGLEVKADREQMGKTPVGMISVEISKAAQKVFVAFRDDGSFTERIVNEIFCSFRTIFTLRLRYILFYHFLVNNATYFDIKISLNLLKTKNRCLIPRHLLFIFIICYFLLPGL